MYLKLSNLLMRMGIIFKSESIYFELKYYLKNNKSFLKPIRHYDRAIGKTYSLIKLANKFKCPIAVPTKSAKFYIQKKCRDLNIKNIKIIVCNEGTRAKRYEKVLCEEGIDEDVIHKVLQPICKCIVGYVNV